VTLQQILEKHRRSRILFDQEPVKEELLRDLRAHRSLHRKLYAVYFTVVLTVVAAAVGAMVADLFTGSGARGAVVTAAGFTVAGVLTLLQRAVREWSQTDLLLRLLPHADEAQIQRAIEALLSKSLAGDPQAAGRGAGELGHAQRP
jgi:hypothetical protein